MSGWEISAVVLVIAMVPVITGFTIIYALFFDWHKTIQGRSLFIAKAGMSLLVNFAVGYKFFEDDIPIPREIVATFVYAIILLGNIGLFYGLIKSWPHRRIDRDMTDDETLRT